MIIHDVEQGTEAWARVRIGLPTCSQLDKILSPKKLQASAQAVDYRNKILAEWITGYPQDWSPNSPWMERGREMEPEARAFYALDRDCDVTPVGFVTNDEATFGGSPDGLVGDDGVLEFKCPALHTHIGYMLEPMTLIDAYRSQVQGYLYLTGRSWADLISYNPDMPPVIHRIEPDAEYLAALAKVLPTFIAYLDEAKEKLAGYRIALEAA